MPRFGRRLLGALLIWVGALALVINFVVIMMVAGPHSQFSDSDTIPFIFGLVLLFLGFVLREGKKRRLLFLRPFNSVVDDLTMKSILGRIGASFTVVALDNGTMRAPRASIRDRVTALLFLPAGLILFLIALLSRAQHQH